jgi:hypothetical protein
MNGNTPIASSSRNGARPIVGMLAPSLQRFDPIAGSPTIAATERPVCGNLPTQTAC